MHTETTEVIDIIGGCKLTFDRTEAGRLLVSRNHGTSLMVRR